ncbi:MAG: flagellar hook-associated protein FlgL [Gemmataceae bacterium]|nr:flagellar hook-associated protein FlgL [Gemmata sp.]MDW8197057.1 flagellar hook-associated protein FlgL [Gemmataceae bacterium]
MRVTNQTQINNAIAYMQTRSQDLARWQDQVSTGLRVRAPSDDPAAFPALQQAKSASQRLEAYTQTIGDATAVLNVSVSSLLDMNSLLVRAREIAQEGADSTSSDPAVREALAVELDGLINRALQIANGQHEGKRLFGGTALTTPPFQVDTTDANGRPLSIVYVGATERARTITGPNQTTETRYVGGDVFQRPGADVFQALIALRDDLRNTTYNDVDRSAALNQRIADLEAARDAVADTIGEQSSHLATLDAFLNLTTDVKLLADQRVGELSATDYAEAVVKLREAETALQAIFAATSRLLQPGFLDFIR